MFLSLIFWYRWFIIVLSLNIGRMLKWRHGPEFYRGKIKFSILLYYRLLRYLQLLQGVLVVCFFQRIGLFQLCYEVYCHYFGKTACLAWSLSISIIFSNTWLFYCIASLFFLISILLISKLWSYLFSLIWISNALLFQIIF